MDASTFDRLAQSLTRSPSRRAAVRLLSGLLMIGPWCGVSDAPGALAKRKKRKKKKCKGGTKKCGKRCIPATSCCANSDCGAGAGCVDGACLCFNGFKPCQGACIADDECCGGCGEEICCKGTCVDLATDAANCGLCGNACTSGFCIHGACDCQGDQANCPAGCICAVREQGGTVCIGGASAPGCAEDDDCALGTNCLSNNFCSTPCVV